MGLFTIVLILLAVGVILYLVQHAPYIDGWMKKVIFVVIAIVVIFWLLDVFGIISLVNQVHIGRK